MSRAQTLIQLYNELSDHLKGVLGAADHMTFSSMVTQTAKKNATVRHNANQLRDLGELRNAIVHYRSYPEEVIAEPTEEALKRFSRVIQSVLKPERLIPQFQKTLQFFAPTDDLVSALRYLREHNFSQMVIEGDPEFTLLTTEGIAKWFEAKAEEDIISVKETKVQDVLDYEPSEHFGVMGREQSIYDAQDEFARVLHDKGVRYFCILVTANGKKTEKPLGLVTPWDFLEIHE